MLVTSRWSGTRWWSLIDRHRRSSCASVLKNPGSLDTIRGRGRLSRDPLMRSVSFFGRTRDDRIAFLVDSVESSLLLASRLRSASPASASEAAAAG